MSECFLVDRAGWCVVCAIGLLCTCRYEIEEEEERLRALKLEEEKEKKRIL